MRVLFSSQEELKALDLLLSPNLQKRYGKVFHDRDESILSCSMYILKDKVEEIDYRLANGEIEDLEEVKKYERHRSKLWEIFYLMRDDKSRTYAYPQELHLYTLEARIFYRGDSVLSFDEERRDDLDELLLKNGIDSQDMPRSYANKLVEMSLESISATYLKENPFLSELEA